MKKMMILAGMLSIGYVSAQEHDGKVGINIVEPKATLEVDSYKNDGTTKEGILIPRLAKQVVVKMKALKPEESTLVYVTDEVATADAADFVGTGKGFYFYDTATSKWTKLGAGESAATPTAVPYENIRGNVTIVDNTTDYTIGANDYLVVTRNAQTTTIRFPQTSEEEKGRVIHIFNDNSVSGGLNLQGNFRGQNTTNQRRGRTFVSDGSVWIGVAL